MRLEKSTDLIIYQKAALCRSFEEEVFRNLQNIAFRDKTEWKRRSQTGLYAGLGGWWGNETWMMEGYLHLDCCVPNQPKTYFNTKTSSWKAADKAFQNYLPKSLVHSTTGIKKTIKWYIENETWWRKIQNKTYIQERLGLIDE